MNKQKKSKSQSIIKPVILVFGLIFLCQCFNQNKPDAVEEILSQPAGSSEITTINKNRGADWSYSKGRDRFSLVDELFAERLTKDKALEKLNNEVLEIGQVIVDSLYDVNRFLDLNTTYFYSANTVISGMRDTVLMRDVQKIFYDLQKTYESKVNGLMTDKKDIQKLQSLMYDKQILLKLFISSQDIKKYQSDNFPDDKNLKESKAKLENLIKEMDAYLDEN